MYIIVFENYKGMMCELIDNVNEVPNRYAELVDCYSNVVVYEIKGEFNIFGDNNADNDKKEHLIKDEATRNVLNKMTDVMLKCIKYSEISFGKVIERQNEIERKLDNKNLHLEKQIIDISKKVNDAECNLQKVKEKTESKCGSKPMTKDEFDKHYRNSEDNKEFMIGDNVIYLDDNRKYVIVDIIKHLGKTLYKLTCDDGGFKDFYVIKNDIKKTEYIPKKLTSKQTMGDFEKAESDKINSIMADVIKEKDEEIEWLKGIMKKNDDVVEYLNMVINNKDRLILRYEDMLDKKDKEIEKLQYELFELGNKLINKLTDKK